MHESSCLTTAFVTKHKAKSFNRTILLFLVNWGGEETRSNVHSQVFNLGEYVLVIKALGQLKGDRPIRFSLVVKRLSLDSYLTTWRKFLSFALNTSSSQTRLFSKSFHHWYFYIPPVLEWVYRCCLKLVCKEAIKWCIRVWEKYFSPLKSMVNPGLRYT